MSAETAPPQSRFSLKTFGLGLLLVALIYGGLFAYAFVNQAKTLEGLESRLASQTVLIDRLADQPIQDAPIQEPEEPTIHTEDALAPEDRAPAPDEVADAPDENISKEATLEDIVGTQSKALREAPVDGFYEETAFGKLPIAKSPAQTPFEIYKKPFVLNKSKPFISIVVDGFGLSEELSTAMIEALPSTVSFILSPYSTAPDDWAQKARADGHEIWLHLPMENSDFPLHDPGAKGLLTRVSLQYNQERLQWLLGRASGYAGIAAYTDAALNNAEPMFKNIARDTFGRGLGYFELNPLLGSFFGSVAEDMNIPYTQSTATLDVINPQDSVLKDALNAIKTSGGTVLVVQPTPRNIPMLAKWLESLQKRGIESVPVSAVAAPDIERN